MLEALELAERTQVGVGVVKADDEADGDQRRFVLQVVQERAAVRVLLLQATRRAATTSDKDWAPRAYDKRCLIMYATCKKLDVNAIGLR